MVKKRKLTSADLNEVTAYVEESSDRRNASTGINIVNLKDIPIKIKCLNDKQKTLKKAIEEKDVVIAIGAAGVGKTYLSLISALHLLKTFPNKYDKIILIKSIQTIKGEDPGTLPGTMLEKMEPFMYSFIWNLNEIFHSKYITKSFINQGVLEVLPIGYCRGITLKNCIILTDEIQNIDMHTFRTIITRMGENSKMIFLGDAEQVDTCKKPCILKVCEAFKDKEYAAVIKFTDDESVRNALIPKILDALKNL